MAKQKTLGELAILAQGELLGNPDMLITGVDELDSASTGKITFVADAKRADRLVDCKASAVVIPLAITESPLPAIRVKNPYLAMARIHAFFVDEPFVATGVSPQAAIGVDCQIPEEISIAPFVFLGDRVRLGKRVRLLPGVVLQDDVVLGDDVVVHANVTIASRCVIGNRVILHPGVVIGSDGFGYATDEQGHHVKRPQVGIVQIDDDVEIGANTCIDRATFGVTHVKQGTKIDNQVQLGHNVVVGEDSLLVAQVGIAGSTTTGRGVVMGGQAGIGGHLHLGDRVMVAAKSGVHDNQQPGSVVAGIPAIPHRNWLRVSAAHARLPELVKEIRELKRQVAELIGERSGQGEAEQKG